MKNQKFNFSKFEKVKKKAAKEQYASKISMRYCSSIFDLQPIKHYNLGGPKMTKICFEEARVWENELSEIKASAELDENCLWILYAPKWNFILEPKNLLFLAINCWVISRKSIKVLYSKRKPITYIDLCRTDKSLKINLKLFNGSYLPNTKKSN